MCESMDVLNKLCEEHAGESTPSMHEQFTHQVCLFVNEHLDLPLPDVENQIVYEATAKKLLGVTLSHDEIMVESPDCHPNDLIIEKDNSTIKFNITTDRQMKILFTKLKLGRKGLEKLWSEYQELIHKENLPRNQAQVKVSKIFGLDTKTVQIILTKMDAKSSMKEHYFHMSESVTNLSSGIETPPVNKKKKCKCNKNNCKEK